MASNNLLLLDRQRVFISFTPQLSLQFYFILLLLTTTLYFSQVEKKEESEAKFN